MKKILLPTDFSENAYNAIAYAIKAFKDEECKFYLLNTYTPVLYDSEYILYNSTQPNLAEAYKKNSLSGLRKVERKINRDFKNPKHRFEKISAFNLLIDEMKEQLKSKEIDLVIMGTQGATGAEEILIGTNSVHAINKLKAPLLMIPSDNEYHPPVNILFPTDFELNFSAAQLEPILNLVKNHNSKINILHVFFGKDLDEKQEENKKNLSKIISDFPHQFNTIEDKSVTKAIEKFQEKNTVDLLFMVNNKRSFFENLLFRPVVNKIGFHIKVPFMVIPSGKFS
ncbi:universal stress protein [Salegentibacter salarius]|uniref:Universal stress protein n=1 Tax=Salegentibacter salarius TaxID=435906 RepID=A0A2N0U558_9FLAO|nr:universal stress protein [Salegentibacter salarius]OEY73905.1 universal stress protein [Salegentibacter salarius]PKD22105.1 universal stress protein [Salegentibacter salarius]SLJ86425.1 Nucleotide-binding universal stress protein, UspA family [Salegentibacter salarius]